MTRERLRAVGLTLVLHLAALTVPVPVLPPGAPGDPDFSSSAGTATVPEVGAARAVAGRSDLSKGEEIGGSAGPGLPAIPYRSHERSGRGEREPAGPVPGPVPVLLTQVAASGFHPLSRPDTAPRLLPPKFSADTIPKKPDKDMFDLLAENAESYLLGDVFQDAVPATASADDLARREADFLAGLRQDIGDGSLDMPFASFIITAEYYQLSRALLAQNLQPAFSLEEALARFRERMARVAEGLPAEIDTFAAVMILQRYAENKFYPGNGSGMLLDSLFHNLNDCEAGTKEMLAYLDELYPQLSLGSNRGLLQTTTGELIGHMQVYLGPDSTTRNIIAGDRGVVIETTRVGHDSILPYLAGAVFPLEDFVARYYPEIVVGTPLAGLVAGPGGGGPGDPRRIVGTSDHPLKMSYGGSGTLLTAQYYDLANIRTRKIENEFLRSAIPGCDPRIDPTRTDRTNLFSNFVAIDPKLRKSLVDHYLAGLDYWDNQVMPHWRAPDFIATYADLAGSLMGGRSGETGGPEAPAGYLQVDAENFVAMGSMESHRQFLLALRQKAAPDSFLGTGRQECRDRTVLGERLLSFLFASPARPGFYFLAEPGADLSWPQLLADVTDDCLAVPARGPVRAEIAALENEASAMAAARTSFRRELHRRALTRGLDSALNPIDPLAQKMAALAAIMTGSTGGQGDSALLAARHSAPSSPEEPSVRETAAERGRSGMNGGLLWDLFDFLDEEQARALVSAYAGRNDLRLSVRRAGEFVDTLAAILVRREDDAGSAEAFLQELGRKAADRQLALAAELTLARLQGLDSAAVSAIAVRYLKAQKTCRAEDLLALLSYGLRPEDGQAFVRSRIARTIGSLPRLTDGAGGADPEAFIDLFELSRTVEALADSAGRQAMAAGLVDSISLDLQFQEGKQPAKGGEPDFGLLFNKLTVLALLRETGGGRELPAPAQPLLHQAVRFAAGRPVGKLMAGLIEKIFTGEQYAAALTGIIGGQFAELAGLQRDIASAAKSGDRRKAIARVKIILGEANVLVRMLLQADRTVALKVAGLLPDRSGKGEKTVAAVAAAYLQQVHRQAAAIGAHGRKGGDAYAADFYLDDRVREGLAMLAFVQRQEETGDRVRFRKIQDIREIKDPAKIQVIEAERKITRQDMSLLTLALNEGNKPREIRRAWEETLAVTDRHLTLAPRDETFAAYLFAPHFPYLQGDDLGFFFSPETVEDLHNADQWGGRNDILLSSYLHFKNLPERLPDWLLRAALARSEFERRIIKKFERESFLPMILECAGDHETLPEGLFRAQWTIRKPFGEDIFPGTLLLLRMGYMTVSPEGELVFTDKYTG